MWGEAYAGMKPITLDHPKRSPQRLNRDMSSMYARRLTLTRISCSASVSPGGRALRSFFLLEVNLIFVWFIFVAGVRSKRPSCLPNLFSAVSLRIFLTTNLPIRLAIVSVRSCEGNWCTCYLVPQNVLSRMIDMIRTLGLKTHRVSY